MNSRGRPGMAERNGLLGCKPVFAAIITVLLSIVMSTLVVPGNLNFIVTDYYVEGINSVRLEGFPETAEFAVLDASGVLSRESRNYFNQGSLKLSNAANGGEIFVAVLPSVSGSMKEVSWELSKALKLGSEDRNNGALILFATDKPRASLRVGSGLKSCITGDQIDRILNEYALQDIREARWNTAARNTWNAVARSVYRCYGLHVPQAVMGKKQYPENAVNTSDKPLPELKAAVDDIGHTVLDIYAKLVGVEFLMLCLYAVALSPGGGGGGDGGDDGDP